jgi:hypothetical protein
MNMENGPHLVVTDPTVLDMLFSQNASHFDLFFQEPIFANLRFGLKLFGQFASLKLWTNFHPKTTDTSLTEYYG